jgi:argininosuccinate synthase
VGALAHGQDARARGLGAAKERGRLAVQPSPALRSSQQATRPPTHTSLPPNQAPDKPTYVDIEFEGGDPVAIDGVKMSPATLLTKLNKLGGDNGIGRIDIVESRWGG